MTYSALHYSQALATAHTSKRDAARDGGLRVWLMRAQGGICFDCGTEPATEFAHFTRAQGRTTADLTVLGAMACRFCNLVHDRITDTLGTDGTLPLAYLLADGRADRIPTDYPTRAALVAIHKSEATEADVQSEATARMARIA